MMFACPSRHDDGQGRQQAAVRLTKETVVGWPFMVLLLLICSSFFVLILLGAVVFWWRGRKKVFVWEGGLSIGIISARSCFFFLDDANDVACILLANLSRDFPCGMIPAALPARSMLRFSPERSLAYDVLDSRAFFLCSEPPLRDHAIFDLFRMIAYNYHTLGGAVRTLRTIRSQA